MRKTRLISLCGILLAWLPGSLPATIAAQEIKDTIVSMEPSYRKALLEEFTGMHCSNCPAGHAVANEIHAYYPMTVSSSTSTPETLPYPMAAKSICAPPMGIHCFR